MAEPSPEPGAPAAVSHAPHFLAWPGAPLVTFPVTASQAGVFPSTDLFPPPSPAQAPLGGLLLHLSVPRCPLHSSRLPGHQNVLPGSPEPAARQDSRSPCRWGLCRSFARSGRPRLHAQGWLLTSLPLCGWDHRPAAVSSELGAANRPDGARARGQPLQVAPGLRLRSLTCLQPGKGIKRHPLVSVGPFASQVPLGDGSDLRRALSDL